MDRRKTKRKILPESRLINQLCASDGITCPAQPSESTRIHQHELFPGFRFPQMTLQSRNSPHSLPTASVLPAKCRVLDALSGRGQQQLRIGLRRGHPFAIRRIPFHKMPPSYHACNKWPVSSQFLSHRREPSEVTEPHVFNRLFSTKDAAVACQKKGRHVPASSAAMGSKLSGWAKSSHITVKKLNALPCRIKEKTIHSPARRIATRQQRTVLMAENQPNIGKISTIAELRREKSKPKGENSGYCKKEIHCFQRRQNSTKISSQDALHSRCRKATFPKAFCKMKRTIAGERKTGG